MGLMMDHLGIPVTDFDASNKFYKAIFATLGYREGSLYGKAQQFASDSDSVWVEQAAPDQRPTPRHIAFRATDAEQIRRFYQAGLAAGGTDNGAPGPRNYHQGYYAAFVLDPDGNNIEAVIHDYRAE